MLSSTFPEVIASYVSAAPSFGYNSLPRYWEEALCLYQSNHMLKESSELSFSGIREETVQRFFNFTRAWMKIKDDPDAAGKLASSYGDSYFYFAIFRYTPGIFHE